MKRKVLISVVLTIIMLLNCIAPLLKVYAAEISSSTKVTLNSELYNAVASYMKANYTGFAYNDSLRTISTDGNSFSNVDKLVLENSRIGDISGLEIFSGIKELDLSNNYLSLDSNLEIINSLSGLKNLDLSSNHIDGFQWLTLNLDKSDLAAQEISNVHLVNVKNENDAEDGENVGLDENKLEGMISELKLLGNQVEIERWITNGKIWNNEDKIDPSKYTTSKNLSEYLTYDNTKVTYKNVYGMIKENNMYYMHIYVKDSLPKYAKSKIDLYMIPVEEQNEAIQFKDPYMYRAVKNYILNHKVDDDGRQYIFTAEEVKASKGGDIDNVKTSDITFWDYDQALTLVINKDSLLRIKELDLYNKQISDLTGLEKFIGLETDLDIGNNYINSIEKVVELEENKAKKEAELRSEISELIKSIEDTSVGFDGETKVNFLKMIDDYFAKKDEWLKKLEAYEKETNSEAKAKLKVEADELKEELVALSEKALAGTKSISAIFEKLDKKWEYVERLQTILTADLCGHDLIAQLELVDVTSKLADIDLAKQDIIGIYSKHINSSNYTFDMTTINRMLNAVRAANSGKTNFISVLNTFNTKFNDIYNKRQETGITKITSTEVEFLKYVDQEIEKVKDDELKDILNDYFKDITDEEKNDIKNLIKAELDKYLAFEKDDMLDANDTSDEIVSWMAENGFSIVEKEGEEKIGDIEKYYRGVDKESWDKLSKASMKEFIKIIAKKTITWDKTNLSSGVTSLPTAITGANISKNDNFDEFVMKEVKKYAKRYLTNNTDDMLASLVKLPRLKNLEADINNIESVEGIDKLSKLETLDLSTNFIVTVDNVNWGNMDRLKTLNLSANQLTDISKLSELAKILENLNVSNCLLSGKFDFDFIEYEIKNVDFSNNHYNDIGMLIDNYAGILKRDGIETMKDYFDDNGFEVNFKDQKIEMNYGDIAAQKDEKLRFELPAIFYQANVIDPLNTDFRLFIYDSMNNKYEIDTQKGFVEEKGKYASYLEYYDNTNVGKVSVTSVADRSGNINDSIAAGTTCTIKYNITTEGNAPVVNPNEGGNTNPGSNPNTNPVDEIKAITPSTNNVKVGDKYITVSGVRSNAAVASKDLVSYLKSQGKNVVSISVDDSSKKATGDNTIVYTGEIIGINENGNVNYYEIVVEGDFNSDGLVNGLDSAGVARYILGHYFDYIKDTDLRRQTALDFEHSARFKAVNFNNNSEIERTDSLELKKAIAGIR